MSSVRRASDLVVLCPDRGADACVTLRLKAEPLSNPQYRLSARAQRVSQAALGVKAPSTSVAEGDPPFAADVVASGDVPW